VKRPNWIGSLIAIGGVALAAAVGAAALPDNPYQRWQLIENTLYANATWSYERMHFDPAPIDVAIRSPGERSHRAAIACGSRTAA